MLKENQNLFWAAVLATSLSACLTSESEPPSQPGSDAAVADTRVVSEETADQIVRRLNAVIDDADRLLLQTDLQATDDAGLNAEQLGSELDAAQIRLGAMQ